MKKIFTQKNCVKATLECPMKGWEGGGGRLENSWKFDSWSGVEKIFFYTIK